MASNFTVKIKSIGIVILKIKTYHAVFLQGIEFYILFAYRIRACTIIFPCALYGRTMLEGHSIFSLTEIFACIDFFGYFSSLVNVLFPDAIYGVSGDSGAGRKAKTNTASVKIRVWCKMT